MKKRIKRPTLIDIIVMTSFLLIKEPPERNKWPRGERDHDHEGIGYANSRPKDDIISEFWGSRSFIKTGACVHIA